MKLECPQYNSVFLSFLSLKKRGFKMAKTVDEQAKFIELRAKGRLESQNMGWDNDKTKAKRKVLGA